MGAAEPDHGGGIDAAVAQWGGTRAGWIDLSTGINPLPYPIGPLPEGAWTALPDKEAEAGLIRAARSFWRVPEGAAVLAAPGASAIIARIPALAPTGRVCIAAPTYNEHGRAFAAAGWEVADHSPDAAVVVHPNNPDGRLFSAEGAIPKAALTVIDESFCDVCPDQSLIARATEPGVLVLKSFGKFWGLAGMRLGFAIGDPALIAGLSRMMGPWPVSGPALAVGAAALADQAWAEGTRARLRRDAERLDTLMQRAGVRVVGGTTLFRLYDTEGAAAWQERLAQHHIWSRIFPYSARWLRLGLPGRESEWNRLEAALK